MNLEPAEWKRERKHLALVFGLLLAVYALTIPRLITLEDSALFTLAAHFVGVVHPPGYPLHTLLSLPFARLPFVSVAVGVGLLSATAGALCCALVYWLGLRLTGRRSSAYVAALGLGLSPTFWSQAIIPEVYTLAALVFFGLLTLALAYAEAPRAKLLAWFALLFGLGLSNHWPFLLLSAPGPLLLLLVSRKALREHLNSPKLLGACLLLFALGLTPYLYLYIRSQADPAMNFYGPLRNFAELKEFILRERYSDADASATAGSWDRGKFMVWTGYEVARQCLWVGLVPALIGFLAQFRRLGVVAGLALTWSFLATSWVLHLGIAFDYGFLGRAVASVYPLVPYGILFLWIALGVQGCLQALRISERAAWTVPAVAALALLATGWHTNDRAHETWAHDYAVAVLDALEPDAVLFTQTDWDTHPIAHVHLIEGVRPDVTLYNAQGLVLGKRLIDPRYHTMTKRVKLAEFLRKTDRPVYFTYGLEQPYPVERLGLVSKVLLDEPGAKSHSTCTPAALRFLERMVRARDHPDDFTRYHVRTLLVQHGTWFAAFAYQPPETRPELSPALAVLDRDPYFFAGTIDALLGFWSERETHPGIEEHLRLALEGADQAVAGELGAALPAEDLAAHQHRAAHVLNKIGGRGDEAANRLLERLEDSIQLQPSRANDAVQSLLNFYGQLGMTEKRDALAERFPAPPQPPLPPR